MTKLQRLLWRLGLGEMRWFRRWVGGVWVQRLAWWPEEWTTCIWYHHATLDGEGRVMRVDDFRRGSVRR